MKVNEVIHGFRVTNIRRLEELSASMVEMEFEKNGAQLIWLDRADSNMSYSISFKTTPTDDTGVFHILEHSVLNGSEKFPLKEPFVDLLKCSMQTFLNAMTFGDKTMYPVSSRNRKDFLNLMDVYTDAVFHPCIYTRKETFLQEGWHYEIDEEGKLGINGVVYSEMQGAFAAPDTQLGTVLSRLLFPDCCYGCVSGGAPEAIPTLSYENFLETHAKYYHPSNAKIFLDGSVDLDACLALLEGYLSPYERRAEEIRIGEQAAVSPEEFVGEYAVEEDGDGSGKAIWGQSFVYGRFDETVKAAAMQVLADVIAGSNESPLRKAVQEAGLCESFSMDAGENTKYLVVTLEAKNADETRRDELKRVIRDTLLKLSETGLDREQLEASINSLEFSARERDYGSLPKGIVFAIVSLDTWLYGGDPASSLCVGDIFDQLRAGMDNGYFEALIREALLENPHKASACLLPSATLSEKRDAELGKKLEDILAGWSEEETEQVRREAARLLELQQRVDTPEEKACLPKLSLSDLNRKPDPLTVVTEQVDGTRLLISPLDTNGILYLDYYFNVRDLTLEELPLLSFLAELYGETGTEEHSGIQLQAMLKKDLGSFSTGCEVFGIPEESDYCLPWFVVSASVLESKAERVAPLLDEVLYRSVFDDRELIGKLLKQRRIAMRESICTRGSSFAAGRVAATATARGVFNEFTSGLEYYRWVCAMDDAFENEGDKLIADLKELAGRLFSRRRLALGITGQPDPEWIAELLDGIRDGKPMGKKAEWSLLSFRSEGIEIPADIGFAAKGSNIYSKGIAFEGSMAVASQLLSYDYLWNVVRVQNGAYGVGLGVGTPGELRFTSYRDPAAAASLDCFDDAPAFLREHAPEQEELNNLIISSVSESEPVRTPRAQGKHEINLTLSGIRDDRLSQIRREMLATDKAALFRFADQLEKVLKDSAVCVVGGKKSLEACGERLDAISGIG